MRIVIVDDHPLVCDLLRVICTRDLGHEVAGVAHGGREAIRTILQVAPELAVLDVHLPDLDAFGVIRAVREAGLQPRILLTSAHCDAHLVHRAERIRVQGFVDKFASRYQDLSEALASLARGKTYFSRAYREALEAKQSDPNAFDKVLSDSEQRLLGLLGGLLSDEAIAARLKISTQTVEKHLSNIRRKLGLYNRLDLLRYARDHGFMSDPPARIPVPAVDPAGEPPAALI